MGDGVEGGPWAKHSHTTTHLLMVSVCHQRWVGTLGFLVLCVCSQLH